MIVAPIIRWLMNRSAYTISSILNDDNPIPTYDSLTYHQPILCDFVSKKEKIIIARSRKKNWRKLEINQF